MKRKIRRLAVPALIAVLFGSALAALVCRLSPTSAAPDNYAQTVEPGGALEAKYLAKGAFRVARAERHGTLRRVLSESSGKGRE